MRPIPTDIFDRAEYFITKYDFQYDKLCDDGFFDTLEYSNVETRLENLNLYVQMTMNYRRENHYTITFKMLDDTNTITYLTVPTRKPLHALQRLNEYLSTLECKK